jgi:hypothetical protein
MPFHISAAYSAAKIHPPFSAAISPLKNDNSSDLVRQKDLFATHLWCCWRPVTTGKNLY